MTLPNTCFLFEGLSRQQMDGLNAISKIKPIVKGQWLFQDGEPARGLYVLSDGAIELVTNVDKDFELPIKMLRLKGDCCGLAALLAPHVYNLSARCAKDARLFELKKEDLESLFQQDNHLALAIMANMSRHLLYRLNEARRELRIHFKTLSDSSEVI